MKPIAHGPDVAHYQYVTDEAAIPAWGLASCKLAEGRTYMDPTAPKWIALFRRKKVRCLGVYFWIRGDSPIVDQFVNLVARLKQTGLDVGGDLGRGVMVQLDWERTYNTVNGQRVLVRDLTVAEIEEFTALFRSRYGDRLITYVSDWVPGFYEWRKNHPTVPLWYANYNLGTTPTGGYAECVKYDAAVWQWTSSYKGDGIASGTPGRPETDTGYDMNHVFDWAVLDRLCLNSPPVVVPPVEKPTEIEKPPVVVLPPVPTPTPTPTPSLPEGDDMRIVTNATAHYDNPAGSLQFGYVYSPPDLGMRLIYIRPVDAKLAEGAPIGLTSAEIDAIGFASAPATAARKVGPFKISGVAEQVEI